MNGPDVERIARALATGALRRRVVGLLGAGLVAPLIGRAQPVAACTEVGGTCAENGDCCAGARCRNGRCRCRSGREECAGQCVALAADDANCGACGVACGGSMQCAEGYCVEGGYRFVTKWGRYGFASDEFLLPTGIVVASDGHVYVVDNERHRVQMFDNDGEYMAHWGFPGFGYEHFFYPTPSRSAAPTSSSSSTRTTS